MDEAEGGNLTTLFVYGHCSKAFSVMLLYQNFWTTHWGLVVWDQLSSCVLIFTQRTLLARQPRCKACRCRACECSRWSERTSSNCRRCSLWSSRGSFWRKGCVAHAHTYATLANQAFDQWRKTEGSSGVHTLQRGVKRGRFIQFDWNLTVATESTGLNSIARSKGSGGVALSAPCISAPYPTHSIHPNSIAWLLMCYLHPNWSYQIGELEAGAAAADGVRADATSLGLEEQIFKQRSLYRINNVKHMLDTWF